jgi:hypothetical protein
MLRKLLIALGTVVALLVLVVATRPAAFHIERSATVGAPPQAVFGHVNDFRAWSAWSPWEKIDPGMQRTFGGPPAGVGSTYAWRGNHEVGSGRMTIEQSDPPRAIGIKLEFAEPMEATNAATFTFVPVPEGTRVTWAMNGRNDFVGKAVTLFLDMDEMVGSQFERGLVTLKNVAETETRDEARATSGR